MVITRDIGYSFSILNLIYEKIGYLLSKRRQKLPKIVYFHRPLTKLQEGNAFTHVCHAVHVPYTPLWDQIGSDIIPLPRTTKVGGTHPTGMFYCFTI